MKLDEKDKALRLRKQGKSYSEICKKINVSKGTLSLWLRDIGLTAKQIAELKGRQKSRYEGAKANQRKRIENTERIISESKQEVRFLYKNPLFLAGLMLYWAEGDKSETLERVGFSNSDPEMIILAMRWFREVCRVPEEKFRIGLFVHELHCRKDVENYWSEIANVPLSQFHKTYVKPTSLGHRRNILYNGTCSVIINNKELFRKIKGWKLGVLEKINRPL